MHLFHDCSPRKYTETVLKTVIVLFVNTTSCFWWSLHLWDESVLTILTTTMWSYINSPTWGGVYFSESWVHGPSRAAAARHVTPIPLDVMWWASSLMMSSKVATSYYNETPSQNGLCCSPGDKPKKQTNIHQPHLFSIDIWYILGRRIRGLPRLPETPSALRRAHDWKGIRAVTATCGHNHY